MTETAAPAWLLALRDADEDAEYRLFLQGKAARFMPCGFDPGPLNPALMPFQADIVRCGLRRGRAAFFEDCGLGKTFQQLEWARLVSQRTSRPVMIFTPLAVAEQTVAEGRKFGISARICESQADVHPGVNVTNYEKLHKFQPEFGGIVLDESSILKGFDGKTRKAITEFASTISYRLCCTATPAPNDYMELGNHAEFLGVMKLQEMLSTFFVHDGGDTSKWRLKRHAVKDFWRWVCSWAVAIRKPSDLGYEDGPFELPELRLHQITVPADRPGEGLLFPVEAKTLDERRGARKASIEARVRACAELISASTDQWAVWCNLNAESESLAAAIPGAVEVTGSDSDAHKRESAIRFVSGEIQNIVSKALIFGWGMNWQHCHKIAVVGLSDSWEQFYQLVRRCWRFGQKAPVDCYVITAETEGEVVRNIQRKENQAQEMMEGMIAEMKNEMQRELHSERSDSAGINRRKESGESWTMLRGDCVEELAEIGAEAVDYSLFSPPFASLYTYSNSDRDMGNCRDYAEFREHMRFLIPKLYRVLKPGRLLSFHCMNLPTSKEHHGYIGIQDFRGDLIRSFESAGFIFHSEVCIWKDPVTAMQRTKALGLLYKQLRKDSCMSRQGIPDYLVTMRKPGENQERVTKTHDGFPVERWQRYASPVWMDINPSDTLQKESAREQEDERHICPLQLQVIERAIELWTNPGDLVLSPFAGIGSEGYVSVQMDRRFIGIELKESYFEQAVANLRAAQSRQSTLFETVSEGA